MRSATVFVLTAALCLWPRAGGAVPLVPAKDRRTEREKAVQSLKVVEAFLAAEVKEGEAYPQSPRQDLERVLAYAKQQKDGDEVRAAAVALARKYARPGEVGAGRTPGPREEVAFHHHNIDRLLFAWRLLRDAGVLRVGMTAEEAVQVLGEPAALEPTYAQWMYPSPFRFSTTITVRLKDGRVEEFVGRF
jgi:hypothetical protein